MYGISISSERPFRIPPEIKPCWPLYSWAEAKNFGYYAGVRNYVYAICYPGGLPFYVGRGVKLRVCQHIDEPWTVPEIHWTDKHRVLLQLASRNESEWYHFLALVETAGEAASIEQRYIEDWGLRSRGGLLSNRTRPAKNPAIEELPVAPHIMEVVERDKTTRRVHHPLILAGDYDDGFEVACSVCLKIYYTPKNIAAKSVQCPYCAHYFKPLNSHWKAIVPEIFVH